MLLKVVSAFEEIIFDPSTGFVIIYILILQIMSNPCRLPSWFSLNFHSPLGLDCFLCRLSSKCKFQPSSIPSTPITFLLPRPLSLGQGWTEDHQEELPNQQQLPDCWELRQGFSLRQELAALPLNPLGEGNLQTYLSGPGGCVVCTHLLTQRGCTEMTTLFKNAASKLLCTWERNKSVESSGYYWNI